MSGILRFSNTNPTRIVIIDWINLNGNLRESKFFNEFSLPGFDSFFQPFLNTDNLRIQFDSSFSIHSVKLKNYYTDSTVYASAPTEIDDRTTYKVFQETIYTTGLDGLYYIEVTGPNLPSPPADPDDHFTARSEPLSIRPTHCKTVKLVYSNDDNAFGIDYETSGVSFDIRIPALFNRTADKDTTELFKDSGGNTSIVSSKGTRVRVLKASELLPQWIIEKVNIALLHDNVTIDDTAVSADQKWPYEVISDRKLWAEPEAEINLASGSNEYFNSHMI